MFSNTADAPLPENFIPIGKGFEFYLYLLDTIKVAFNLEGGLFKDSIPTVEVLEALLCLQVLDRMRGGKTPLKDPRNDWVTAASAHHDQLYELPGAELLHLL